MESFLLKNRNSILLCALLLSLLMHMRTFNKELISIHVWRQTQTQSTIVNFYEEDFNILHPKKNNRGNTDGIFRMEFPLMQWLIACLYKLLGNHLIITRICTFVIGVFSILGIYRLIAHLFRNELAGLFGAFAFTFSPCIYYYMVNPLPDNFALCLSIWGLAYFFNWVHKPKSWKLVLTGLFLAIGSLCKLPFLVYYSIPIGYFCSEFFRRELSFIQLLNRSFWVSIWVIFPAVWYIIVIPTWHGNGIVQGMLDNEEGSHQIVEFLIHNLVSALPELLLNYVAVPFFILGFYFLVKNKAYKHKLFLPLVLCSSAVLVYFFFEINMISKDHDYYLFPFYPLLFILVAYGAVNIFNLKPALLKYTVCLVMLVLPITCYLRMHHRWDEATPGFNPDLLTYKNELRNIVPKDALCIAGNDRSGFIYFYYLDKKGWSFNDSGVSEDQIRKMIQDGAAYLYSDDRNVDENPALLPYLTEKVDEKGSFRIYSLAIPSN